MRVFPRRFSGALLGCLLLLPLPAAADPATARPPNVLLIVIDTLRYSATSFGDPTSNNTPFLASLGSRGAVFTRAYSTHDFTPTSHFSMFTGLRDGLGTDDDRLENGVAYQLHRIGYDTFATVANSLIGRKQMPTEQGFERFKEAGDINAGTVLDQVDSMTGIDARLAMYHCRRTPHTRAMLYFSADRLLAMFLHQIREARAPYFGFVNLVDPHEPYVPDPKFYPPEPALPRGFEGDVLGRRPGPELLDPDSIKDPERRAYVKEKIAGVGAKSLVAVDLSPETLIIYRQRYEAKVRSVDSVLAEFFAEMETEKLLKNTVVIITSDHGESFGEGDLITHMFHDGGDFESTHHVPLLIVLPPKMRTGAKTTDRRVSIAGIAPTIYDLAGLNWSGFQAQHAQYARSLFPLLTASRPRYVASVLVPKRESIDQSEAEGERTRALKALGYVN